MKQPEQQPVVPNTSGMPAYQSQNNQHEQKTTMPPDAIKTAKEWVDANEK